MRVGAALSALRGNGAILTGIVAIVRGSGGSCKTPDDGTPTGAGGGAGRTPDGGYAAGADGGTTDVSESGIVTGACATTRSHQGSRETSVSTIWPRASDSPAMSTITGPR